MRNLLLINGLKSVKRGKLFLDGPSLKRVASSYAIDLAN